MSRADDIGALIEQSFPGARVTSTVRTRAEQDALIARGATKARNSQHLTGNGLDVVLPRGVSPAQIRSFLADRGINPGEFLNERGGRGQGTGAHLHIGLAPKSRAPAKGGDRASASGGSSFDRAKAARQQSGGSDMAAVFQAYRNTGKAGGMTRAEAAQYEHAVLDGHIMLPRGAALRVKPAAPVLPAQVVAAYNSHRMDDDPEARAEIERSVAAGEVSLPRGMRLQKPEPRTAFEQVQLAGRAAAEGIVDLGETALRAISPGYGMRPAQSGGVEFTQPGRVALDRFGDLAGYTARPESDTELLRSSIIGGAAQGLVTGPVGGARGIIGRTALDMVSGGAAGGSQETARQAGAGPVGQVIAGLAGGGVPIAAAAGAARLRAPKTLPDTVAEVPRAAVMDEAGNLTPEGQELAARHGASPEEVRAAYDTPPDIQRAAGNDQMPAVTAREATTGEPVAESVPTSSQPETVAPQAKSELPPQPNAPSPDQADVPLPATARARVDNAAEFGIDMGRGQATKSFDIQDREARLRNSNGPEAEQMRAFTAKQTEQVKQAVDEFKAAIDHPGLTTEQRGQAVQEAIRELRDNGQKGVTALYRQARELGQEVPLDTTGIRNAYERLMVEADVPDSVKNVLTQEAARYGIIGKAAGTAENKITTVKIDDGAGGERPLKFYGEPETLRLDNAEAFRQVVSKQYQADGGQKLTQVLKSAIDDATEAAATKLAQYGQEGATVPKALEAARAAHVEQVKTFRAKDIVQSISDWKKGTNTDVLKPEQVMQKALASTSDLKRIKAVLLSKPTAASKAAWRAIQAHGVAAIFAKATQTNSNIAGEVAEAISGSKLRSAIDRFGTDKLKVLLEPEQFNQMMRLRKAIEDVTIPIAGTTNPSGSGNLIMRLVKDVDNQVTAAFTAAGMALGGPAGAAVGGAAGRTVAPAIKAVKEGAEAAETLKGATEYTPERAATDTGEPKAGLARKATTATKKAGAKTIRAFIDTYSSPRVIAPVLATTEGQQE